MPSKKLSANIVDKIQTALDYLYSLQKGRALVSVDLDNAISILEKLVDR